MSEQPTTAEQMVVIQRVFDAGGYSERGVIRVLLNALIASQARVTELESLIGEYGIDALDPAGGE